PVWVEDARKHLESVSDQPWWRELVTAWLHFERVLEYPEGQVQSNWLHAKHRPEEVKFWINRGRHYDKPPKIKSLSVYVGSWRKWWARLQPDCRRTNESVWPLERTVPTDATEWSRIRRGGCNGVFMAIMCLSWWFQALEDGADVAELRSAVEDVTWVCATL
ncbi:hypothetical protein C8Q76DRAFT_580800, partial [Earliella scabrosa]